MYFSDMEKYNDITGDKSQQRASTSDQHHPPEGQSIDDFINKIIDDLVPTRVDAESRRAEDDGGETSDGVSNEVGARLRTPRRRSSRYQSSLETILEGKPTCRNDRLQERPSSAAADSVDQSLSEHTLRLCDTTPSLIAMTSRTSMNSLISRQSASVQTIFHTPDWVDDDSDNKLNDGPQCLTRKCKGTSLINNIQAILDLGSHDNSPNVLDGKNGPPSQPPVVLLQCENAPILDLAAIKRQKNVDQLQKYLDLIQFDDPAPKNEAIKTENEAHTRSIIEAVGEVVSEINTADQTNKLGTSPCPLSSLSLKMENEAHTNSVIETLDEVFSEIHKPDHINKVRTNHSPLTSLSSKMENEAHTNSIIETLDEVFSEISKSDQLNKTGTPDSHLASRRLKTKNEAHTRSTIETLGEIFSEIKKPIPLNRHSTSPSRLASSTLRIDDTTASVADEKNEPQAQHPLVSSYFEQLDHLNLPGTKFQDGLKQPQGSLGLFEHLAKNIKVAENKPSAAEELKPIFIEMSTSYEVIAPPNSPPRIVLKDTKFETPNDNKKVQHDGANTYKTGTTNSAKKRSDEFDIELSKTSSEINQIKLSSSELLKEFCDIRKIYTSEFSLASENVCGTVGRKEHSSSDLISFAESCVHLVPVVQNQPINSVIDLMDATMEEIQKWQTRKGGSLKEALDCGKTKTMDRKTATENVVGQAANKKAAMNKAKSPPRANTVPYTGRERLQNKSVELNMLKSDKKASRTTGTESIRPMTSHSPSKSQDVRGQTRSGKSNVSPRGFLPVNQEKKPPGDANDPKNRNKYITASKKKQPICLDTHLSVVKLQPTRSNSQLTSASENGVWKLATTNIPKNGSLAPEEKLDELQLCVVNSAAYLEQCEQKSSTITPITASLAAVENLNTQKSPTIGIDTVASEEQLHALTARPDEYLERCEPKSCTLIPRIGALTSEEQLNALKSSAASPEAYLDSCELKSCAVNSATYLERCLAVIESDSGRTVRQKDDMKHMILEKSAKNEAVNANKATILPRENLTNESATECVPVGTIPRVPTEISKSEKLSLWRLMQEINEVRISATKSKGIVGDQQDVVTEPSKRLISDSDSVPTEYFQSGKAKECLTMDSIPDLPGEILIPEKLSVPRHKEGIKVARMTTTASEGNYGDRPDSIAKPNRFLSNNDIEKWVALSARYAKCAEVGTSLFASNHSGESDQESDTSAESVVKTASEMLMDTLMDTVTKAVNKTSLKKQMAKKSSIQNVCTKSRLKNKSHHKKADQPVKIATKEILSKLSFGETRCAAKRNAKEKVTRSINNLVGSMNDIADSISDNRVCWDSSMDILPSTTSDSDLDFDEVQEEIVKKSCEVLNKMTDTLIKNLDNHDGEFDFKTTDHMTQISPEDVVGPDLGTRGQFKSSVVSLRRNGSEGSKSSQMDVILSRLMQARSSSSSWGLQAIESEIPDSVKKSRHKLATLEHIVALLSGIDKTNKVRGNSTEWESPVSNTQMGQRHLTFSSLSPLETAQSVSKTSISKKHKDERDAKCSRPFMSLSSFPTHRSSISTCAQHSVHSNSNTNDRAPRSASLPMTKSRAMFRSRSHQSDDVCARHAGTSQKSRHSSTSERSRRLPSSPALKRNARKSDSSKEAGGTSRKHPKHKHHDKKRRKHLRNVNSARGAGSGGGGGSGSGGGGGSGSGGGGSSVPKKEIRRSRSPCSSKTLSSTDLQNILTSPDLSNTIIIAPSKHTRVSYIELCEQRQRSQTSSARRSESRSSNVLSDRVGTASKQPKLSSSKTRVEKRRASSPHNALFNAHNIPVSKEAGSSSNMSTRKPRSPSPHVRQTHVQTRSTLPDRTVPSQQRLSYYDNCYEKRRAESRSNELDITPSKQPRRSFSNISASKPRLPSPTARRMDSRALSPSNVYDGVVQTQSRGFYGDAYDAKRMAQSPIAMTGDVRRSAYVDLFRGSVTVDTASNRAPLSFRYTSERGQEKPTSSPQVDFALTAESQFSDLSTAPSRESSRLDLDNYSNHTFSLSQCTLRSSRVDLSLPRIRHVESTKSDYRHVLQKGFIDRLDNIIKLQSSRSSQSRVNVSAKPSNSSTSHVESNRSEYKHVLQKSFMDRLDNIIKLQSSRSSQSSANVSAKPSNSSTRHVKSNKLDYKHALEMGLMDCLDNIVMVQSSQPSQSQVNVAAKLSTSSTSMARYLRAESDFSRAEYYSKHHIPMATEMRAKMRKSRTQPPSTNIIRAGVSTISIERKDGESTNESEQSFGFFDEVNNVDEIMQNSFAAAMRNKAFSTSYTNVIQRERPFLASTKISQKIQNFIRHDRTSWHKITSDCIQNVKRDDIILPFSASQSVTNITEGKSSNFNPAEEKLIRALLEILAYKEKNDNSPTSRLLMAKETLKKFRTNKKYRQKDNLDQDEVLIPIDNCSSKTLFKTINMILKTDTDASLTPSESHAEIGSRASTTDYEDEAGLTLQEVNQVLTTGIDQSSWHSEREIGISSEASTIDYEDDAEPTSQEVIQVVTTCVEVSSSHSERYSGGASAERITDFEDDAELTSQEVNEVVSTGGGASYSHSEDGSGRASEESKTEYEDNVAREPKSVNQMLKTATEPSYSPSERNVEIESGEGTTDYEDNDTPVSQSTHVLENISQFRYGPSTRDINMETQKSSENYDEVETRTSKAVEQVLEITAESSYFPSQRDISIFSEKSKSGFKDDKRVQLKAVNQELGNIAETSDAHSKSCPIDVELGKKSTANYDDNTTMLSKTIYPAPKLDQLFSSKTEVGTESLQIITNYEAKEVLENSSSSMKGDLITTSQHESNSSCSVTEMLERLEIAIPFQHERFAIETTSGISIPITDAVTEKTWERLNYAISHLPKETINTGDEIYSRHHHPNIPPEVRADIELYNECQHDESPQDEPMCHALKMGSRHRNTRDALRPTKSLIADKLCEPSVIAESRRWNEETDGIVAACGDSDTNDGPFRPDEVSLVDNASTTVCVTDSVADQSTLHDSGSSTTLANYSITKTPRSSASTSRESLATNDTVSSPENEILVTLLDQVNTRSQLDVLNSRLEAVVRREQLVEEVEPRVWRGTSTISALCLTFSAVVAGAILGIPNLWE